MTVILFFNMITSVQMLPAECSDWVIRTSEPADMTKDVSPHTVFNVTGCESRKAEAL